MCITLKIFFIHMSQSGIESASILYGNDGSFERRSARPSLLLFVAVFWLDLLFALTSPPMASPETLNAKESSFVAA